MKGYFPRHIQTQKYYLKGYFDHILKRAYLSHKRIIYKNNCFITIITAVYFHSQVKH